jgi:hypothetical protein
MTLHLHFLLRISVDLFGSLAVTLSSSTVISKCLRIRARDWSCSQNKSEPEFLNIFKCNSAESVSAGFQFNFLYILNKKINMYSHFVQFSIL